MTATFEYTEENNVRRYRIEYDHFEYTSWKEKRQSLLVLGLIFCKIAIDGRRMGRKYLTKHNIEPKMVDAVLGMNALLFGGRQ